MAKPTGRPNGRPPKPVEQKRLLGNPGHRHLPDAPAPGQGLPGVSDIPAVPVLGVDGTELWIEIWESGKSWLSPKADRAIVRLLCQAYDEHEQIRRALAIGEVPRHYVLPNGSYVSHPYVTQMTSLRSQMTAWYSALGFSPADRARLGLGEVRQMDSLDELEQRRNERLRRIEEKKKSNE